MLLAGGPNCVLDDLKNQWILGKVWQLGHKITDDILRRQVDLS